MIFIHNPGWGWILIPYIWIFNPCRVAIFLYTLTTGYTSGYSLFYPYRGKFRWLKTISIDGPGIKSTLRWLIEILLPILWSITRQAGLRCPPCEIRVSIYTPSNRIIYFTGPVSKFVYRFSASFHYRMTSSDPGFVTVIRQENFLIVVNHQSVYTDDEMFYVRIRHDLLKP